MTAAPTPTSVMTPVTSLRAHPRNYQRHPPEQALHIRRSIEEHGFYRNVVVARDGTILAGHGVWETATAMGLTEIPVVRLDVDPDSAQALRVVTGDNEISRLAEVDDRGLAALLQEISAGDGGLLGTGFTDAGIGDLLREIEAASPSVVVDSDDRVPDPLPVAVSKRGQIYMCGPHRVMCGDATELADVRALVDGHCRIAIFSPPYNVGGGTACSRIRSVGSSSATSKYATSADKMTVEVFAQLINRSTENALAHADTVVVNVQLLSGNKRSLVEWLHRFRAHLVDVAIWNKGHGEPAMVTNVMNAAFELLFFFSHDDEPGRAIKTAKFRGTISNVYSATRGEVNEHAAIHAATFPVHLPAWVIKSFDEAAGPVLDLFGGTGTTLIAASQLGRVSRLMEIEPVYCDVIRRRWTSWARNHGVDVGSGGLDPVV